MRENQRLDVGVIIYSSPQTKSRFDLLRMVKEAHA